MCALKSGLASLSVGEHRELQPLSHQDAFTSLSSPEELVRAAEASCEEVAEFTTTAYSPRSVYPTECHRLRTCGVDLT